MFDRRGPLAVLMVAALLSLAVIVVLGRSCGSDEPPPSVTPSSPVDDVAERRRAPRHSRSPDFTHGDPPAAHDTEPDSGATSAPPPTASQVSGPQSEILVQVRHPDGTPAATVPVELRSAQRRLRTRDSDLDILQSTDDTGRTTFRGYHGHLHLSIGDGSSGAAHHELQTAPGSRTEYLLTLRPARRLHGRIRAVGDDEVREIVVSLHALDEAGNRVWATSGAVGPGGQFDSGWTVPNEATLLRVEATVMCGPVTGYGTVERDIHVSDLTDEGIELVARPPAHIRMRVVDEVGRPLKATGYAPRLPKLMARGRADGRIELGASLANPLRLVLRAGGHAPRWLRVEPTNEAEVDLGDVVMARGAPVSGRLVDEDGVPLQAWWVNRETVVGHGASYFLERVRTDATGAFRFEHVADEDWVLRTTWAHRFTHVAPSHESPAFAPGSSPVEWRVPRPTWVEVSVSSAMDPVTRLEVVVRRVDDDGTAGPEVVRRTLHRFRPTSLRIEVPGAGRYRVELTPDDGDPVTGSFDVQRAGHTRVVLTR